jgi:hypothetical protein
MSKFSESEKLNREYEFYTKIVIVVHIILATAGVIISSFGIKSLEENGLWSLNTLVKLILALLLLWYYYHSCHKGTGLFYALELWEQSLSRRRSDDELMRAYYTGERIIVDFREAEVFNGHFLPKPGGIELRRGERKT